MALAAMLPLPYYRHILPYGLQKFCRFAMNVWDVDPAGKTDEAVASMKNWMKELGLIMNFRELGADEEMLEDLADAILLMDGGYKVLECEKIINFFRESL